MQQEFAQKLGTVVEEGQEEIERQKHELERARVKSEEAFEAHLERQRAQSRNHTHKGII